MNRINAALCHLVRSLLVKKIIKLFSEVCFTEVVTKFPAGLVLHADCTVVLKMWELKQAF